MNLSDYRTRLIDVFGGTLTVEETFYNRIINDAYRKLCALNDWWWLETYEVLRFDAPVVSSRSCDCVLGTADIVPSATAHSVGTSYKYGYALTGNHAYRIIDVSAASPFTITLDSNFIETSSAYGMTFWNDTLSLATAFDHSLSLAPRNAPNHKSLRHVDMSDIERHGPDVSYFEREIGQVYSVFYESAIDASRARIKIFPPPDETSEYVLRYIQSPADLAHDTATTLLPGKHDNVLADLSRLELLKVQGADANEVAIWEQESEKGLARIFDDQHKRGKVRKVFGRKGSVATQILPFKLVNYTVGDPI